MLVTDKVSRFPPCHILVLNAEFQYNCVCGNFILSQLLVLRNWLNLENLDYVVGFFFHSR